MKLRLKTHLMALLTAIAFMMSVSIPAMAAVEDTGFFDVAADAWYAGAVEYVRGNGLMSGTADTAFSPDSATSRAMLVTILYRQAGSPAVSQAAGFSDVSADAWYADAVAWAAASGVVSGYTADLFGSDDPVTREQMAAILWRYNGSPAAGSTEVFADQSSISGYAADAVAWARESSIVSGKGGNLFDPNGQATRAEAAVILQRYEAYLSQTDGPDTPQTPDVPSESETAITITVGSTVIPATLNDSTAARDLLARLPLTVSMTRGSVDYYASLPDPLDFDEADVHNGWHNGDIGFDGAYLTMFHAGEDTSASSGNQITLGRIGDLTLLEGLGTSIEATFALAASTDHTDSPDTEHRTLVVYYSHSQRTEQVAQLLEEKTGGDLYTLVPEEPYTGADSVISARATQEIESGNLPALSGTLPDLSQYDTILVGGPVWSYTVSSPILSYLEQTDFAGKTVAPFWTDQGGPGDYVQAFTRAARNAGRITDFLQLSNTPSISESDMSARLDAWLETVFD